MNFFLKNKTEINPVPTNKQKSQTCVSLAGAQEVTPTSFPVWEASVAGAASRAVVGVGGITVEDSEVTGL